MNHTVVDRFNWIGCASCAHLYAEAVALRQRIRELEAENARLRDGTGTLDHGPPPQSGEGGDDESRGG